MPVRGYFHLAKTAAGCCWSSQLAKTRNIAPQFSYNFRRSCSSIYHWSPNLASYHPCVHMSRLVDYFVVVEYDQEKERAGKVLQRFPENDWPDTPFHQGIEMFCQPQGWRTYQSPKVPEFFISVLTDIDAFRHYCACLTFTEPFLPSLNTGHDEDEEGTPAAPQTLFAPKSLCLISRHEYFETFRQCLGVIFAVYADQLPFRLEVLIGNLLGFVQVPPAGGPQTRFSIGAGDSQAIQPPLSSSLPISRDALASFCREIGVSNAMLLLCAALSDTKILFLSSSYLRLAAASHALITMMYPLKYSHVYVPVLPAPLLEVLNSPTPFIMGIHISLREQVADLLDVIFVDLDGCRVDVPESVTVSLAPEPIYSRTVSSLKRVLDPTLLTCDHAFPEEGSPSNPSAPRRSFSEANQREMLDKELRAVQLQFFCDVFAGYRSCLTVVRIHPEPVITFQKAQFLGQRNFVGDEFVSKVVSSMSFGRFVHEYASPYRKQSLFDEIYAEHDVCTSVLNPDDLVSLMGYPLERTKEIANRLYTNENPPAAPFMGNYPKPSNGTLAQTKPLPPFPWIDARMVDDILQEGLNKQLELNKWPSIKEPPNVVIPLGCATFSTALSRNMAVNSNRRLEVLSNCINYIFESRINDAKKLLPAVIRVLASPSARLALSNELSVRVQSNRAMLDHQQFELVVKLINAALQDDSTLDEYGVAAAFLPLITAFCRKLCTGVIQFVYTRVQEHEIWSSLAFWESAFYKDVQHQITALYWPAMLTSSPVRRGENHHNDTVTSTTALDIAAEQLRSWPNNGPNEQKEFIDREESTVFSQAIHYANRIVYLRVPLDINSSRVRRRNSVGTDRDSNSNFANSFPESDNGSVRSEESGFQEDDGKTQKETNNHVVKFVMKFVDKVCGESLVTEEHVRQLHQMVPGVVAMHIEGLEAVYKESKHLQPIQKAKLVKPQLLVGEEMVIDGLRCHLLLDGRDEGTGGVHGGPSLLPCEGALFLTTYRVIFMGSPVDSYVSDYVILRSFPVASLTKEKRLSGQYITQVDQFSPEALQLRSATFQLLRVGFDEEVTSEVIEQFRKLLERMRYPLHVMEILNHGLSAHTVTATGKSGKKAGIRGFAKKTLQRTARAAGIKTSKTSVKKDMKFYSPATPLPDRRMQLTLAGPDGRTRPVFEEEGSDEDSDTLGPNAREHQSFERIIDRSYVKDYRRVGLIAASSNIAKRVDEFRLSQVNINYKVCPTYPALLVVPNFLSDDNIRSLARHFRENRFPAVTWQHARTKAVLIRSGSYQTTRMSSVFKSSGMSAAGSLMTIPTGTQVETVNVSSQADFEKYLSSIVRAMPSSITRRPSTSSAVLNGSTNSYALNTPDSSRKQPSSTNITPWNRAVQTLRTSSGKGTVSKRSSAMLFPSDKGGSLLYAGSGTSELTVYSGGDNFSDLDGASLSHVMMELKSNLFVLADKTHIKSMKQEPSRCEFIPLEYPDIRRVKAGHKKLLQVLVPSGKETAKDHTPLEYLKQVENLDWLKQIQRLLKLAGAVVDLMDVQGASVLLALEDGWDATCQLSALAQLLMDPYYRTIQGFADLVDKEFSAFGHRFAHRNNLTQADQNNGIAPIFIQFLDCVAQVLRQFPMSFEFNEYMLKYLAFHSISNRFTNFLTDCESDRVDLGLIENRRSPNSPYEPNVNQWPVSCGSVWDYIELVNRKNSKFYNFVYAAAAEDDQVLRPFTETQNIHLWEFYLEESLAFGSLYDLEIIDPTAGPDLGDNITKSGRTRRIVNSCYNNPSQTILSSFSTLFSEIRQLETEMGVGVEDWQEHWDRMDQDGQLIVPLQKATPSSQMIRSHSRRLQTQITMEILDKGKNSDSGSLALGHPHRFVRQTYTTPSHCNHCSQVLWGNALICADCGFHAHEKCEEQIPNSCSKVKVQTVNAAEVEVGRLPSARSHHVSREGLRDASPSTPSRSQNSADHHSASESRVMEGYLFKRGAVLKAWKPKWFVLDSMKHQLRYYETNTDPHVRGIIDLSEVLSVGLSSVSLILQGAPKRFDDKACFDVRTLKRTFNLCAKDPATAQEWMEKMQLYLQ